MLSDRENIRFWIFFVTRRWWSIAVRTLVLAGEVGELSLSWARQLDG